MDNYFVGSTLTDLQNARTAALQIDEQRREAAAQRFFNMMQQAAQRGDARRESEADRAMRYFALNQDSGLRGREMDLRSRGMDQDFGLKSRGVDRDYELGKDRNTIAREQLAQQARAATERAAAERGIAEMERDWRIKTAEAEASRVDPRIAQEYFRDRADADEASVTADAAASILNERLNRIKLREQAAKKYADYWFTNEPRAKKDAEAEFGSDTLSTLLSEASALPVQWDGSKFIGAKRKPPANIFDQARPLVPPTPTGALPAPSSYFPPQRSNAAPGTLVREWDPVAQRFIN